jgi:hypothetical protein
MIVKDPGSRLLRWRIQLEEYDYETVYKPGTQNANADALSRIGNLSKEKKEIDEVTKEKGEIDEVTEEKEEINEAMKSKILQESHDSILGGHREMNKTYKAIKQQYYSIPQQDAETVARKFVQNIVLKFGAPAQILTDQG